MNTYTNNKSAKLTAYTVFWATYLLCSHVFLNNGLAQNRYWFGADTTEGGNGVWHISTSWSSTTPTYTAASAPTTANDAYLQGGAGTINFNTTVAQMKDLYINTSGYTLNCNTPAVNFVVSNILGPGVSSTTITNSVASTFNFVISSGFSPSFTGTFTEGTGTLDLRKQGDGLLDLTGAASISYTGTTQVDGGTLRMNIADLGSGNMIIGSVAPYVQGIFESNGTFTRSLGAGAGDVRVGFGATQSGGFSANGADLNINFGGSSSTVNWDTTIATNITIETFVVGASTATHTTNVLNPINVTTTTTRILRTENGSAAIDANFSGLISGVAGSTINKTGDGVTRFNNGLSEVNVNVNQGTLYINGTISQAVNRNFTVASGATLGGYATTDTSGGLRNTTVQANGILAPGRGNTSGSFGSFSLYGDLTMQTDSVLAFGIGTPINNDQLVRLGGAWSFDPNQRVTVYDYGVPTSGQFAYPIITGLAADPVVTSWTLYNSPGLVGYFYYDAGTVYLVLPEAKHAGIVALVLLMAALIYRSRKNGVVGRKVA